MIPVRPKYKELSVVSFFIGLVFVIVFTLIKHDWSYRWYYPFFNTTIAITCIGVFWYLFNQYIWRWKISKFCIVDFPDLNGSWEGTLKTDGKHSLKEEDLKCSLTIKQTYISISCRFRTNKASSNSITATLLTNADKNEFMLIYCYENTPVRGKAPTSSRMHHGTAMLDFDANNNTLEGNYYTNREVPTQGSLELKRVPK